MSSLLSEKSLAGKVSSAVQGADFTSGSILRRGKVDKLPLGMLAIYDTYQGAWATKTNRRSTSGLERVYYSKRTNRVNVDTIIIGSRCVVKASELTSNKYNAISFCLEKAKKGLLKQEEALLAEFIFGATIFVPRAAVEQTQKLFEDLGRPITVAAEENKVEGSLAGWSKKLYTAVRCDVTAETLFDSQRDQFVISLWEDVGWWVPAHDWHENRKNWKNGSVQYSGF